MTGNGLGIESLPILEVCPVGSKAVIDEIQYSGKNARLQIQGRIHGNAFETHMKKTEPFWTIQWIPPCITLENCPDCIWLWCVVPEKLPRVAPLITPKTVIQIACPIPSIRKNLVQCKLSNTYDMESKKPCTV
jgi:hypothetical protein